MGLDTYAVFPVPTYREGEELLDLEQAPSHLFAGVDGLCGGMFSGHGNGSFRGKVYNDFVEEITRESLYQGYIPRRLW